MLRESSDRLSGIGSSIQVRLPVRVNQMRLQAARDRQAQAEVENRKTDSILAQSQKRFEEETAHPELGRQRVELQLLKAQIQQQREMHQVQIDKMKAKTSALKAQAILAERRAKQLETAGSSDGPKATEPN